MGHRSHTSPTVWVHYILRRLHIPPHYFLVFLAMLVGWLTAWAAYIFQVSIYWLQEMVLRSLANHWAIVFVPVLGGLICGQIIRFSAKEARGQGIAEVMYAVLMRGGIIPMRVAISKIFATVATLGSMGAAGQEGPIVQIGSALGSGIGQWFRLSSSTLKILVGCGAAAGISATFQAPIGGVLFALEVILGTFSPNTFTPIIIASVIASVTFQSIGTTHSMLNLHVESPGISMEMIGFVSTGLFCGLVSVFMIRSLCASERWFQRIRISEWVKPALGGLVIGILMLMWPLIGGSGERMMAALATGEIFPPHWLLALLLIKLVAICATLGSGGSGGVFFPSLVIGAVSGLFCHSLFSIWFSLSSPSLYMLIGMAAVVSGTTHGPIAAIIVLCELSGHFSLILPLMAASISSVIVARALLEVSIYGIKLKKRGIHLKDGHDLDILRTYKVGDIMESNIPRVNGDTPLSEIIQILDDSRDGYLLIEDQDKVGILSHHEITPYLLRPDRGLDCEAKKAMYLPKMFLASEEPILKAHEYFSVVDIRCLPVQDQDKKIVGLIFKKDIIRSYRRALKRRLWEASRPVSKG